MNRLATILIIFQTFLTCFSYSQFPLSIQHYQYYPLTSFTFNQNNLGDIRSLKTTQGEKTLVSIYSNSGGEPGNGSICDVRILFEVDPGLFTSKKNFHSDSIPATYCQLCLSADRGFQKGYVTNLKASFTKNNKWRISFSATFKGRLTGKKYSFPIDAVFWESKSPDF